MQRNKYRPDQITYELFGINPAEFYKTKFAVGRGCDNALAIPVYRYEITYDKIRRLIADMKSLLAEGAKALDIGCGAAPYGPTLLANVPGVEICGVDMSADCLDQALSNGYSRCELLDLTAPLPFEDESFDFIFSMDMLGHIEFRNKDFLISEMARVTKRGGCGHHGVETGFVDYFNCNPMDDADPVRKYVLVDGHIGAEPAQDVCDRFARHFTEVAHKITYLYPFLHKDAFAEEFGEEFKKVVSDHGHPEAVQLANVILGRLNNYFIDLYSRVFGEAFKPHDAAERPITAAHQAAREMMTRLLAEYNESFGVDFVPVPKELFRPAGFSSITVKR